MSTRPSRMLRVEPGLQSRFPGLQARIAHINQVMVERENSNLETFRVETAESIEKRNKLETLKDGSNFRAYRDSFWKKRNFTTTTEK